MTSPVARSGALLLGSQAASSVLNLVPSAVAIATLTDVEVATMVIALTAYLVMFSVGRSAFGEVILVLTARHGLIWGRTASRSIRRILLVAGGGFAAASALSATISNEHVTTGLLICAVSAAMIAHDVRRYYLTSSTREMRLVVLDGALLAGTAAAFLITWIALDESVNLYLTAWLAAATLSSAELLTARLRVDLDIVIEVVRSGLAFGYDPLANRLGLFVVAIFANEVAGAASLADAEALRLSMAAVNIAFLGAGPIALRRGAASPSILRDGALLSAVLAAVACAWWGLVSITTRVFADITPDALSPWHDQVQWAVLIWFVAAAVPFGFRYRLRTALANRAIVSGATAELVVGVAGVAFLTASGTITSATEIFAAYFVVGALAWAIVGGRATTPIARASGGQLQLP